MKIYFDTCVWIRPFESEHEQGEHEAITKILQLVKESKIKMFTSRQVELELNNHVKTKNDKRFKLALKLWNSTEKEFLPYPAFVLGDEVKSVIDKARLGNNRKFLNASLQSQDKDIAEFLVDNEIEYFISVDEDFTNTDIVQKVLGKDIKVMKPVKFIKSI